MKSICIAGLCLAAMLVVSMAVAGTASAAPHWLVCLEGHSGTTKWETHQCELAASGPGAKWEWGEAGTEYAVVSHETLKLEVPDPLGGTVTQVCVGKNEGFVGPKNKYRITMINEISCVAGEKCEKVEKAAEPVHLPWDGELLETEGKIHATIRRDEEGGEPGWRAACKVSGLDVENECVSEGALTVLENRNSKDAAPPALLVLVDFLEPNKPKADCTSTGIETGDVLGSIAILLANKWALAVSK